MDTRIGLIFVFILNETYMLLFLQSCGLFDGFLPQNYVYWTNKFFFVK